MDSYTAAKLKRLADRAAAASARVDEADEELAMTAYAQIRGEAEALNEVHHWATEEEFETLLPTVEAQLDIDDMNEQFGYDTERKEAPPVFHKLLRGLSAWATGLLAGAEASNDRRGPKGA